jgi:hypothetical protein
MSRYEMSFGHFETPDICNGMKVCEIEMAVSVLRTPDGRRLTDPNQEPEVGMSNHDSTPRDSRAAETVNGRRYQHSNAQVYLNPDGLPVAFRRVRVLKPGTFAGASRLQLITPREVVGLSRTVFNAYRARCHPLN